MHTTMPIRFHTWSYLEAITWSATCFLSQYSIAFCSSRLEIKARRLTVYEERLLILQLAIRQAARARSRIRWCTLIHKTTELKGRTKTINHDRHCCNKIKTWSWALWTWWIHSKIYLASGLSLMIKLPPNHILRQLWSQSQSIRRSILLHKRVA